MVWLVLALWLVVYPLTLAPRHLASVHLAVSAVLLLLAAPRLARRDGLRLEPQAVATLLALASLGVAIATAPYGTPAADFARGGLTGLAHGAFFLALRELMPGPRAEASVARRDLGLLLGGIVLGQGVLVLIEAADGDGVLRAAGSIGNPNALGACAGAAALALGCLASWRPAIWLAVVPLGAIVLATRSRGAAAATLAMALVLAARRFGGRFAAGAMLALLAVLAIVPNPLRERMLAMERAERFSRPFVWARALEVAAETPTGTGPGVFKRAFARRAYDPDEPSLLHQRHAVGLTHNVFLTLLVEWGWLAAAAALGLIVWSARVLGARGPPDALGRGAVYGGGVLLVAMQWSGLEQNPLVVSLLLVLAAVALHRAWEGGPAIGGRVAAGVAVALALLLGWRAASGVVADLALERAGAALAADAGDARAAIDAAARAAPLDTAPARMRARLAARRLRTDSAGAADALDVVRDQLARARALDPLDPRIEREAANVERTALRLGVTRSPEPYVAALERVLALDPLDVVTRWELARQALLDGRDERWEREAAETLRLEPDYAEAWWLLGRTREADGDAVGALEAYLRAEDAISGCRRKRFWDNAASQAFFEANLEAVEPGALRARIEALLERMDEAGRPGG